MDQGFASGLVDGIGYLVEGISGIRVEHRDIDPLDERQLARDAFKNRRSVRRPVLRSGGRLGKLFDQFVPRQPQAMLPDLARFGIAERDRNKLAGRIEFAAQAALRLRPAKVCTEAP